MNRQEFYVAASRSREETFIYATPELARFDRDEFAPQDPYLRDGLEHIAEAAERDGSQAAAVDAALRAEFGQLPTDELARRLRELRAEAGAEHHNEAHHQRVENEINRETERLEEIRSQPGSFFPGSEQSTRERIERAQAEREQLPEIGHQARAEAAVAEHLTAERVRAASTAARLSPPDYIKAELGERPSDPTKAGVWDTAVRGIEGYRIRNGVVDRGSALGPKQTEPARQHEQRQARKRIERAQRQLGRAHDRAVERGIERGIGR